MKPDTCPGLLWPFSGMGRLLASSRLADVRILRALRFDEVWVEEHQSGSYDRPGASLWARL